MLVLASCSIGGGDDDDDESRVETPEVTATTELTATTEPSPTETAEPTPTATATATSTPTPTPTSTSTPTPSPTPTATPLPVVENPFADAPMPDAVLENYTLSYRANFTSDDAPMDQIELLIEQHSPTSFHVNASGNPETGREAIELWVAGEQTFLREPGGEIFELPSTVDPTLFSPSAYVILTPDLSDTPRALEQGVEEVEGRQTTRYLVSAEHVAQSGLAEGSDEQDPEGEMEVWVDTEQGFIVRMVADVAWTDENGARRKAEIDYLISNVGSTPEIGAPV